MKKRTLCIIVECKLLTLLVMTKKNYLSTTNVNIQYMKSVWKCIIIPLILLKKRILHDSTKTQLQESKQNQWQKLHRHNYNFNLEAGACMCPVQSDYVNFIIM